MKLILLPVVALAALLALAPSARAGSDLEKEMKVLKKVTRDLGRLEGDFAKGQELAKQAIEASKKSREMVPEKVADMKDELAKTAATEEYKKQMDALIEAYAVVEKACMDKDEAKLKESLDALDALKKKGHQQFTDEE